MSMLCSLSRSGFKAVYGMPVVWAQSCKGLLGVTRMYGLGIGHACKKAKVSKGNEQVGEHPRVCSRYSISKNEHGCTWHHCQSLHNHSNSNAHTQLISLMGWQSLSLSEQHQATLVQCWVAEPVVGKERWHGRAFCWQSAMCDGRDCWWQGAMCEELSHRQPTHPYRAPYEAMVYNTSHGKPACVHEGRQWRCRESNPVPLACKASALPYELHPLFVASANASHCACSHTCFPRMCSVPLHDQASVARSAVDFAASASVVHNLALHQLALLAAYVPPAPASNWLLFFQLLEPTKTQKAFIWQQT